MSKADKTHFVGKQAVHKGNRVQGCRELTVGRTRAEGVGGASPLSLAHLKKKSAVMDFTCGTSHLSR